MTFRNTLFQTALCFFLASAFSIASAHVGHKEEEKKPAEEVSGEDSIYAAEEKIEEPQEQELFDSLAGPGLFEDTEPMSRDMDHKMDEMETEMMDHMNHRPEVELAGYEWVSTTQKGYAVAAGITVLAGLAFGVLSIFRPFE